MTPDQIRLMEIQAQTIIAVADNEGWPDRDGVRVVSNMALEAVEELRRLQYLDAQPATLRIERKALAKSSDYHILKVTELDRQMQALQYPLRAAERN